MPTATVEVPRDRRERVAWLHEYLSEWEATERNWKGDICMADPDQLLPPNMLQWLSAHPALRYIDRVNVTLVGDCYVVTSNGLMPRLGQIRTVGDLQAADPEVSWRPQRYYAIFAVRDEMLVLQPR